MTWGAESETPLTIASTQTLFELAVLPWTWNLAAFQQFAESFL